MSIPTLVVGSGGLDSVTLAYLVKRDRKLTRMLSFNYGQRHVKELDFAARAAADLGVPHDIIDISGVAAFLTGSALTDDVDVPDGHYTEDSMRITVVPNRNAIMLTIAYGVAAAEGAGAVAAAMHAGDHFIYPDCRPAFVDAVRTMHNKALEGMWEVDLYTPFIDWPKSRIAALAGELGLPIDRTWSCYKGGEIHCGRCGTCVERIEALHLAGVADPTPYDDPDYWKEAVARVRGTD